MSKRPSLAGLTSRLAPKAAGFDEAAAASDTASALAPSQAPSRDFKTMMLRCNRKGWQEMSRLAIDEERNLEDLLIEACNDLLQKHGRPPIIEKRSPPRN